MIAANQDGGRTAAGTHEADSAAAAVIAVAMRKPALWAEVRHVRAEWMPTLADRWLWQGLQQTLEQNGGLVELAVLEGWLLEHYPSDADALLARLAEHCNVYLEFGTVERDVLILERHGLRRELRAFAQHILELLDDHAPLNDIWETLTDAPQPVRAEGGSDE